MTKWIVGGLAALIWLGSPLALAADSAAGNWDGLVEIKPKRIDAAFLLPGADFRPYTKLMLDPVEVAFKKDWEKNYNRDAATLSNRLTPEHVEKIAAAAREAFSEVFNEAYQKAGLQVVTTPGPDVLRVRPGVVNLYIAAPDTMTSSRSRTYTMESGEATLFLELRDSATGALLGRALDRRNTRNTGRVQVSNSVTNLSDFRALFRSWADISIKGFQELRASSPVPADLKPGQKLKD
jgi:Protein of unknown function (DUF3313)